MNIWEEYERRKKIIDLECQGDCEKYETAIKQLTAELNI